MIVPAPRENDFERKVRESEEALLRSVPVGKRPFNERWWFFSLLTAQFWFRLVLWPFQDDHTGTDNVFAGIGLALLIIGIPVWAWGRRQSQRERAAAHAAGDR